MTKARKFGVELEVIGGRNVRAYTLAAALTNAGVTCEAQGYNHSTSNVWKIVPDGSLRGFNAMELVSPPMTFDAASVATLRTVCGVLNSLGVTVNGSCGFHVHVDASDLEAKQLKNLVAMFCQFESAMDTLVPASRRSSEWARSNARRLACVAGDMLTAVERAESAADLRAMHGGNRYQKLNLEALGRHGTVEFRQAAGTTNADKVVGWVAMCVGLVSSSRKLRSLRSKTQFTFSRLLGRVQAEYRPLLVARRRELAASERRTATRRANEAARRVAERTARLAAMGY